MSGTTGPIVYPNEGPLQGAPMALVDRLSLFPNDRRRASFQSLVGDSMDLGIPSWSATVNLATYQLIGAAATLAAQAVAAGVFRLGTPATDNVSSVLKLNGGPYTYTVGKSLWFVLRCALDNLATGEAIAGMLLNSYAATDLATLPTSGLFFLKAETAVDFSFIARNASASTTIANVCALAGVTLTADVMVELAFRVDLGGNVGVFVNGISVGQIARGDANLPTTLLSAFFGRQAAGANIRYMDVDYFLHAGAR
jgi:hypothetical protein